MTASSVPLQQQFFGVWVVRCAFVMAIFGWGVGFYGPPVFLHAVIARTGWPLALVSAALTVHFLVGALVVANLPRLHRRFGLPACTGFGAAVTALGAWGWAVAALPWQLFAAALLSGAGWVTMGAATINAVIAPWYTRARPMALAKAYNGASIGGVIFSPLWVMLIAQIGFAAAALTVGVVMTAVVVGLAYRVFAKTPDQLGQAVDGDSPGVPAQSQNQTEARALPGRLLWRDRQFVTLAAGMAAGLFAQIGLIAHLFSLLVPALGARAAGLLMGLATACAIGGRLIAARSMTMNTDRRLVLAASYAVQIAGTLILLVAGASQIGLIVLGVVLFGSGIGNATSLPPLVAQVEFAKVDLQRAVALIVAIGQATYAFAPAVFGVLLAATADAQAQIGAGATGYFSAVAAVQAAAIGCFLFGRNKEQRNAPN